MPLPFDSPLVSAPAVRNDPPAVNDWGVVTRPIFSTTTPIPSTLVNVDAFGRYRFSLPETIFDSQQIVDNQPFFWDDQQTAGAGTTSTFNPNQASTTIAVAAATAGTRVRQTKRQFYYQPGKGQLINMTFVMSTAAAGNTKRVGQFNTDNGLFLQQSGAGLAFGVRTFTSGAAVDTVIPQAAWNLDRLDGTGPSGITLDVTKTQILVIAYEWLGVGSVFFGFFFNGTLVQAHRVDNTNISSLVFMSLPELPLRYEIANNGAGPIGTLTHICSTVISEGGRQGGGLQYSVDRLQTGMTTLNNTSLYPVVTIRLRSGFTYATVVAVAMSLMNTSNSNFVWRLVLNPTFVGAALAFTTPFSTSAVQADLTSTNATTITAGTGTVLASGYGAADTALSFGLPDDVALGISIAGTSDILTLAVSRITGTTETFFGALQYRELR